MFFPYDTCLPLHNRFLSMLPISINNTQGARPQNLGPPDTGCCKRLLGTDGFLGPSAITSRWTTFSVGYSIPAIQDGVQDGRHSGVYSYFHQFLPHFDEWHINFGVFGVRESDFGVVDHLGWLFYKKIWKNIFWQLDLCLLYQHWIRFQPHMNRWCKTIKIWHRTDSTMKKKHRKLCQFLL